MDVQLQRSFSRTSKYLHVFEKEETPAARSFSLSLCSKPNFVIVTRTTQPIRIVIAKQTMGCCLLAAGGDNNVHIFGIQNRKKPTRKSKTEAGRKGNSIC